MAPCSSQPTSNDDPPTTTPENLTHNAEGLSPSPLDAESALADIMEPSLVEDRDSKDFRQTAQPPTQAEPPRSRPISDVAELPAGFTLHDPFTEYGPSLVDDTHPAVTDDVHDAHHFQADLNLNHDLHQTAPNAGIVDSHQDFYVANPTPLYATLMQDSIDWASMNGHVAPMDFSDLGANVHLQNPSVGFPAYQAHLPAQHSYQFIAPAMAQPDFTLIPGHLPDVVAGSSADASAGPNINALQFIQETRIRCTVGSCTKTFRRPGDFRRHMKKHQTPTFKCIDVDCDMKFYRLDKLRDHLRQGHKLVL